MARVEQIKKFTVLPTDWAPGGDELTPTMKLKRKPIAEKYDGRDRGALRRWLRPGPRCARTAAGRSPSADACQRCLARVALALRSRPVGRSPIAPTVRPEPAGAGQRPRDARVGDRRRSRPPVLHRRRRRPAAADGPPPLAAACPGRRDPGPRRARLPPRRLPAGRLRRRGRDRVARDREPAGRADPRRPEDGRAAASTPTG